MINMNEQDFLDREATDIAPVIILSNLLSKIYDERLSDMTDDVFLNQKSTRFVLAVLSKKEGITQNDLVRVTHMKGATISITIGNLEEKGMVTRVPDRYDQRCMRVYLTEKGWELNQKREKILNELEQKGNKSITPRELKDTVFVLKNYVEQLLNENKK